MSFPEAISNLLPAERRSAKTWTHKESSFRCSSERVVRGLQFLYSRHPQSDGVLQINLEPRKKEESKNQQFPEDLQLLGIEPFFFWFPSASLQGVGTGPLRKSKLDVAPWLAPLVAVV